MTRLSIIICNYNTRDDLNRCLQSVQACSEGLDLEVIVVDNASHDGSADMVRAQFPSVKLIKSETNLWFTGGNNLGLRAAGGLYILFLNPDTIILPGTLQTLVAYMDTHPSVGAVTPHMAFADGTVQRTCSRVPSYVYLLLAHSFLGVLCRPWLARIRRHMWYADWDRLSTRPVEVIPDSAMLVRHEVLRQTGPYDEAFRLYFTEDDLSRRILDTGAEIHYVAEAKILHREHASVSQVQRLATRIYFEDMLTFCRKYYGTPRTVLLSLAVFPTRLVMQWRQRR